MIRNRHALIGDMRIYAAPSRWVAWRMADAGKLSLCMEPRQYDLALVEQAHAAVAGGNAAGKIVVSII